MAATLGTMGSDHPMTWYHKYDGGRAFYTAFGHTESSYSEPDFLAMIRGAIEWTGENEAN